MEGLTGFVPNDELYQAIGIPLIEDRHPGVSKLVTGAMARLGWKSDRVRCGGDQRRGYASPTQSRAVLEYVYEIGKFRQTTREQYKARPR